MKRFIPKVSKKTILILLTLIIITTLTSISATEQNQINTTHTNHINKTETTQFKTEDTLITDMETDDNIQEIQENTPETIYLTKSNYQNYDGSQFKDNSNIIINETLEDYYLEITNKNITITGNNTSLINSQIVLYDDANIILSNLTLISDDNTMYPENIIIESNGNILENLLFIDYKNRITDDYYRTILVYGDNNIIENCIFDVIYPSMSIDWVTTTAEARAEPIVIHGNNNTLKRNIIHVKEAENKQYPFGTIFGVSIRGNNNTVDLNEIVLDGTIYMYGLRIYKNNNLITNNYIEVTSIRYANGISIEGRSSNNTLRNNTIILKTENTTIDNSGIIDVSYGIIITEYAYYGGIYNGEKSKTSNNIIDSNTIAASSTHVYGIETFGGTNSVISNNDINVTGLSAIGIASIGSNTQINTTK